MTGIPTAAAFAAKLSGAKAALAKIPPQVWYALAAIALVIGGYFFHQHKVHRLIADTKAEQRKADDAMWHAELDKVHAQAVAWKARAESQAAAISQSERKIHEQTVALDAADARALSLRGPGKAAAGCRPVDHPIARTGTSGHDQAAAIPNAAGSQVPAGDWATVPWDWLVKRAQEHDDLRSEDQAWRSNDAKQRALKH